MLGLFITMILGLVGTIVGAGVAGATNKSNEKSVEETNQANLEAVERTNTANAEQAELAYQRSKPETQVFNMMQAGMSKPAALNALTGGGTYTAPVMQSAQAIPKQFDYSKIGEAFERLENIPGNVQQRELVDEQINALRQETEIKRLQAEMDMQERAHDLYVKQYGQKNLESMDRLRSKAMELAREKDIDLRTLQSEDDLVKMLGLAETDEWKDASQVARDNIFEWVRLHSADMFARNRDFREFNEDARKDAMHHLDVLLKNNDINLNAKTFQIKVQKTLAELNKLNADASSAQLDNAIKKAGFDSRKDAEKFFAEAQKFKSILERDKYASQVGQPELYRGIMSDVEYLIDKINIFKGFFH